MISYIGGKSKIGKWIVPFYPHDMETYVEPFQVCFGVFLIWTWRSTLISKKLFIMTLIH